MKGFSDFDQDQQKIRIDGHVGQSPPSRLLFLEPDSKSMADRNVDGQ
jgi:hypothetical protein